MIKKEKTFGIPLKPTSKVTLYEEAPTGGTGKKKLYNFDILPPTNASPAPFVSTISSSLIGMIGYSVTLPSAKRLGKNLLPTFENRAPDWEFGVKSR